MRNKTPEELEADRKEQERLHKRRAALEAWKERRRMLTRRLKQPVDGDRNV